MVFLCPFSYFLFGIVEFVIVYILGMFFIHEFGDALIFHTIFALCSLPLAYASMRLRGYRLAAKKEVRGRFRRVRTFW